MEQEIKDYIDSLRKLREQVEIATKSMERVRDSLKELVDSGYLRSTITMLNSDIVLRRRLENIIEN